MSFLPDLAGWALSGGAGRGDSDDGQDGNDADQTPIVQESEEEIRAKRLARLAARFDKKDDANSSGADANETSKLKSNEPSPMEVDNSLASTEKTSVKEVKVAEAEKPKTIGKTKPAIEEGPSKKIKAKESKPDPARKIQRKKELLLKKMLKIKLAGGSISDSELIEIDIGTAAVSVEGVSEILATRLALSPKSLMKFSSSDKGLFSYLGACHKRVAEELKNMPAKKGPDDTINDELRDILQEMKRQVVSYAATSLMAPDLFELAQDGALQLTECLKNAILDPVSSLTIGVNGKNSSFYSALCDELMSQDEEVFESLITGVVKNLREGLSKTENVLENSGNSGLVQVSALTALCSYKKAAVVVTRTPDFVLPSDGSSEAAEKIAAPIPPPPPGATPQQLGIYRLMSTMGRQSYLKRSGPGLEKQTLLGLILRLGTPMDSSAVNSQFQNVARSSRSEVQKRTDTLRRQLKVYQETVYSFVKCLITAGEEARKPVSNEIQCPVFKVTTFSSLLCNISDFFVRFVPAGATMVC